MSELLQQENSANIVLFNLFEDDVTLGQWRKMIKHFYMSAELRDIYSHVSDYYRDVYQASHDTHVSFSNGGYILFLLHWG